MADPVNDDFAVLCPFCGDYNTHQESYTIFERQSDASEGVRINVDEDAITVRPQDKLENNPSSRRQGLTIGLYCESGHDFWLHVYQHKGQTYLETALVGPHLPYEEPA